MSIFDDYFTAMGLFDSLFGNSDKKDNETTSTFDWLALNEITQLDDIIEASKERAQAIFKHSTRCGISSNVIRRFEKQTSTDTIDFYYLDLLAFRPISSEIANRFNVMHESPQLVLIKDGVVVSHASHGDILNLTL